MYRIGFYGLNLGFFKNTLEVRSLSSPPLSTHTDPHANTNNQTFHSEIFLNLNTIFLYLLASVLYSFSSQVNDGTVKPFETIALNGKVKPNLTFVSGLVPTD